MGFFSAYHGQPGRTGIAVAEHQPSAEIARQVPCDRCQVACAKVEVITHTGSLFLCQHHHREHRASIIAAGHQILRR
jgi:hypothetical protein